VANAIRAKSGGSGSLAFPAGFVTEIGNISGGGTSTPDDWLGKEAELFLGPYTLEKTLAETDFATWTPSTTSSVILSAQDLVSSGTVLPDLTQYDYMIRMRFDFKAARISGAEAKSTVDRYIYCGATGEFAYPSGLSALNQRKLTGATNNSATSYYFFYYSSTGVLTATTTAYGIYASSTPSISGSLSNTTGNFTLSYLRTPPVNARCHNTYFTTARASELDQAASKFKFWTGVYRCKRTNIMSGVRMDMLDLYHNPL
jgi:hypothetical protein